jgi:hypothetical protein
MTVNVRTLKDFRRFLAQPGATIEVVFHDWIEQKKGGWGDPARIAAVRAPRTVKKLQTNAVKFSNDGWLFWDNTWGANGAKSFRFSGDTVDLDLSRDGSFREVCTYKLSIAGAPA